MYGIAGCVNWGDTPVLVRMTQILAHRIPDDQWKFGNIASADGSYVGLGSLQLAILDLLPAGHIPMTNKEEKKEFHILHLYKAQLSTG